ncbi:hypothetical protein F5146DRAFT_1129283 [Armillaria mellea]|nr:hypothetical protein F5146DRAFT_1129283 [Armillaria mellea]
MAPDPSMLPVPVFDGTASLSVQRQSLVIVHATGIVPSHSTEPCVFPPPPTYAEIMDMVDDLPIVGAMRRARAMDPIGYVAEAIHPEDFLPPSFDDIARMEPHLPWDEVMKRAGNIDQAALIRDTISRQGPDGLEASFERPSEVATLQTISHQPTISIPESITKVYNQSSMNTENAVRSLLILSSSKDRMTKELKTLSVFITIWLHATITNGSRAQPTTDSASIWKPWSTFSETVIVIQAIMETLTLDHITIFHGLVYVRRLFGDYYIHEDEAYLRNAPTIVARVFFVGCLLGFKYCQDDYSVKPWGLNMGIDRRTVEEIGRHALHGLGYRLDISPNDWKASLEDFRRIAATCSFSSVSGYKRTVVNDFLDKLKINSPPGIPLRARTSVSEQGNMGRPLITYISGIFTGAVYSPQIILKAAEARPAAPWNVPNDSVMGHDTRHHSASKQGLKHRNRRHTAGGRVSIEHRMQLKTQSSRTHGVSAGNGQTFWHVQRIQPDQGSFGIQSDTQNDLPVSHGAAMMARRDIRPNVQFLETQRPPLVARSVQDHRMIWQSDNRISGQRLVSGGLIFRGLNETNIWAPQRGEYPGDQWLARQGSQIASRTSLW